MAKHILLCGSLLSLLLIAGLTGCTNPKSNPVTAPPEFREGIPLPVDTVSSTLTIPYSATPYVVSHDWVIPEGQSVTIAAGTEIMFDSLWSVDVRGRIVAQGTSSAPIIFTSAHLKPDMGQWRGFILRNPNPADASVFEHCVFSWGAYYDTDTTSIYATTYRGMMAIVNSSPQITRCMIVRNQNNAIYMTGDQCRPKIRYNIMTKNDASAVRADTTVPLPEQFEDPNAPDIAYNCVGENSAISFLMGFDSTRYGSKLLTNQNLDSCDLFYNIDMAPLLQFQLAGRDVYPGTWARDGSDFALQSCSPCIDAGPASLDLDPEDQTRADMGGKPYVQSGGELRGVVAGDLQASIPYRMSCNVRVNAGTVLRIPAGTQIETTGLYTIEVYGKLVVDGAIGQRVRIAPGMTGGDLWGGIIFLNQDTLITPSEVRYLDVSDYQRMEVFKPGTVFENCLFDHGYYYGLFVSTGIADLADTVRVANSTFDNCGAYGIGAYHSALTVRNSVITHTRGRGITIANSGDAVELTNNIVFGNETIGLEMLNYCSPRVINNVFAHNGYTGIEMQNNCNPVVRNTIVYNDSLQGVHLLLSSQPVLTYNNVFGNGCAVVGQETVCHEYVTPNGFNPPIDDTDLSVEPQFVSSTDFHLAAGSPCIGRGMNDDGLTPTDMGAYGGPGGGSVGASTLRQTPGGLASK